MSYDVYPLRIESGVRERLQKIADAQDRPLAYVCRKALDEYLLRHEPQARSPAG